MHRLFHIISLFFCYHFAHGAQPYFPPQIVFTTDSDRVLFAIDEINQRAFISFNSLVDSYSAYVFKHIPYAPSDSPQAKNYVQLQVDHSALTCQYETFWEYGGYPFSVFPYNWGNATSYKIGTFLQFRHQMIHSKNSSDSEDYWYANETCRVDSGERYPCEEIFFKKNTDIPLRYTEVVHVGWAVEKVTIKYDVKSIGKPDDKYFDTLPKNWSVACQDAVLGLSVLPQTVKLNVEQSVTVQVRLLTPPHRINGNDTVFIRWNATYGCTDCLTWKPKQLIFNIENFQEPQHVTITRVKNKTDTILYPIFNGGGFDLISPAHFPIVIL